MLVGRIEIKAYWYFDSYFRKFLDKLIRYFGQSLCGWWILNKAYDVDNDITYFLKHGHSYKEA